MKNLVIVESPSKANTINKYLGDNYSVKATMGHIKDLPKSKIGVDIEHGFEPFYEIIKGKEKTAEEIKKYAKAADTVFLAADPDREGEAIAWNVKEIIDTIKGKKPAVKRVLFNEITKDAVNEAIKNPTELNEFMFESQKARRILDRLVGYNLSPFLWKKVGRGLSAGRVQSVTLYLIVEREKEINNFVKEEYWTLSAVFLIRNSAGNSFTITSELAKINSKDPEIKNAEEAEDIKNLLLSITEYKINSIGRKSVKRNSPVPLITSTMQQEAFKTIRFSVKKTMNIAQKLYEGIELGKVDNIGKGKLGLTGLITYMRTDSTRISDVAAKAANDFIVKEFGKDFAKNGAAVVSKKQKTKKIQDAHEAIRPSNVFLTPEKIKNYLSADEYKLYKLIWTYFVASQMSQSIYDQYSIVISGKGADENEYLFKTAESVLKFEGYLKVLNKLHEHYQENSDSDSGEESNLNTDNSANSTYNNKKSENKNNKTGYKEQDSKYISKIFEVLKENDPAFIQDLNLAQHFTAPPSRYTEASLVKALDENGVGRPSTYQTIISNIKNKDYVETETETSSVAKFKPTELGIVVSDILKEGFPDILDIKFTANMENKLDEIENGTLDKNTLLKGFYDKLIERLAVAGKDIASIKGTSIPTDIVCDKCGKPMVVKFGRFGKFLACSGYPECKNTRELSSSTESNIAGAQNLSTADGSQNDENSGHMYQADEPAVLCEKCGKPMVLKSGRFGKFLACSGYPECKNTKPVPLKSNIPCPNGCGGYLAIKKTKTGKRFYGCSNYPTCNYTTWKLPKTE
ncbi:MAG: type I DNA topoisomerase [Candidatus Acididesulfobacter guangdongensis]|uniref:DNA topoisomerase 1 n=1 Tax=Acididesulfobacter guangdongensis TaxID=2597225 RepID=A0A519BIL6_ACIG2|nr:MAG: type I DNA topoisomerase [Candidatus Acididesulfobacter guangdongensis]